jgi:type VI secretion system secreted protein VgrG
MSESDILIEASLSIEGSPFTVLRYQLHDALSELSALDCEAMEIDVEPKPPAELLGKTATLELMRTDGLQSRSFSGRIVRAERISDDDDVRTLKVKIAPVPWSLSKRSDCRVFQHMTVVDIAKEVLEKAGVPSDRQRWNVTGEHPEREYLVQYRETDLAFVQRILAEEGIYFAVHHEDGKDVLVLGDDPGGLGDAPDPKVLPYHHGAGFDAAFDRVMRLRQTLSVTSDKVMLRDYNPDKPKLAIEATVESEDEGSHALEIYDYPARAADPGESKRLGQVLLDEVQVGRNTIEGETGALTLAPGLTFSIELHPYAPLNGDYIVTSVRIEGSTARLGGRSGARGVEDQKYRCAFTAVPKTTRLAPARRPRAARVVGLHTAFTTGPAGEEIHVSDKAQVTIRYHWDRLGPEDDGSSLFARTLQMPLGDSMLLPRMDWEVSVAHVEGDPDRPLVLGRMYDGIHKPPYGLPGDAARSALQTATSPGGGSVNEMRMGDSAGSEEMFFNASKDASIDVKNNTTESVANNCSRSVGSNQTKNVTNSSTATVGGSQSVSVGGNQSLKVETQLQDEVGGDHSLSVGGNRDMKVGGDHKRDVGGDSSLDVGGMQVDLVVGSVTDDALGSYTHNVGAALIDITAADRSLLVGGSISETAGAAKVVAVAGGRGVEVGGSMTQQVAGAIIHLASGSRAETAGATYTEIAAGAQIVKADNISIEADTVLSLVMGASTLTLLPALVALAGVSIKLDGPTADLAALVVDN